MQVESLMGCMENKETSGLSGILHTSNGSIYDL
jgi:hypothetical protein